MNDCRTRAINERSNIIPISQKSPTNKKEDFRNSEYSLKQNFFDPSKSSPPNEFMLKLKIRMDRYNLTNFNNLTKE